MEKNGLLCDFFLNGICLARTRIIRISLSRVNFSKISFRYASFTIVLLFFLLRRSLAYGVLANEG